MFDYITGPLTNARKDSLVRLVPDLFTKPRKILYVGAKAERADFMQDFILAGCTIDVLEIHEPNYLHVRNLTCLRNVYLGDIRSCPNLHDNEYDLVFWWHGPEHVQLNELEQAINECKRLSSDLVILGCPWGDVKQGAIDGNVHEAHIADIDPEVFITFGFKGVYFGNRNILGSCIVAVSNKDWTFCDDE